MRYASPEQLSGTHHAVNERSDVYSLGATLWEMVTGKRLFAAEDHNSVITQVLKVEAPRPRSVAVGLPRDLETIIARAMAKAPVDRYATAEALSEDLRRFLDGRPILAKPLSWGERAFRWANRNRSLATTAVASLAVLALVALTASALILRANSQTATALETSRLNEDEARKSAVAAEASERKIRELLYAADMALAGAAWKTNEPAQVRMILDRYAQPKTRADGSKEEDLRGFEWYFLDRQVRPQSERLFQNDKALYWIEFIPDGKEFLTAGQDGIVRWHDANTGKVLRSLDTQQKEVNGVSYNPSGKLFATAGEDGTVKVWNAADLTLVKSIDVYDDVCYSARFFGDDLVFTCGNSAVHWVLNASTGQRIRDYTVPTPNLPKGCFGISKSAFVRQASNRFWTSEEWTDSHLYQGLYEWNANTGESRRLSPDHFIQNVLADRSEKLVFYNTLDGVVRVFDASAGRELQSFQFDARMEAMTISPDERQLVVGDESGQILVWKLDPSNVGAIVEPEEPTKISAHEGGIYSAMFSPNQSSLLSVGSDGAVRRTPMQSGLTPSRELDWMRNRVCAPIPGTDLVIATKPLAIRARTNGEIIRQLTTEHFSGVAANADGTLIAAGSSTQVGLWNASTGEELKRVNQTRKWSGHMSFSADDTLLSVFSRDFKTSRVDVLDLATGTMEEIQLGAQRLGLLCIDDGLVMATPRQLVCWKVRKKSVRWTTKHFEMNCTGGAVSPDLRTMVAGDGPLIRLIDCASGNVIYKVPCHHAVKAVEFAPDGRTFLIGGGGGELSVWHTATGQHLFDIGDLDTNILEILSLTNGFLARTRRVVNNGTTLEERYYEF